MATPDSSKCGLIIQNCQSLSNSDPTLCSSCDPGYGYDSTQTVCNACSDPSVTNDQNCASCSNTPLPSWSATCTACQAGYANISNVCTLLCVTPNATDSTKC